LVKTDKEGGGAGRGVEQGACVAEQCASVLTYGGHRLQKCVSGKNRLGREKRDKDTHSIDTESGVLRFSPCAAACTPGISPAASAAPVPSAAAGGSQLCLPVFELNLPMPYRRVNGHVHRINGR